MSVLNNKKDVSKQNFETSFFYALYSMLLNFLSYKRKRQIMRQSLNSTPPVMGGAASGIRPEDYLTMA